jgi:hypothetical protein
MSYVNKTEVLEGIILKLKKKVKKLQNEKDEINVKLEVYPNTEFRGLCEGLSRREERIELSIQDLEDEIKLHEKALNKEKNGNANIHPFLE